MKKLKLMLLFVAFTTAMVSCKKENVSKSTIPDDTGSNPLSGRWVGKFGFGDETPDAYYSFKLKSDGTLDEMNSSNEKIGEGTWTLTGTIFKATHHYTSGSTFKDEATYDAATKTFSNGTWGYTTNSTDGGKWFMKKQ